MPQTLTVGPLADRTTLYYRQGSSDKVYQVSIERQDRGFVVAFAFGRRGSTLQTGVKTAQPVDFDTAKILYDKLVNEKTAKGYTPGENGTPYTQTPPESRVSGVLPQLLNPIDEQDAEKLLADEQWWTQPKFDGKRILIRKTGDEVAGINRRGLLVGLPDPVIAAVRMIAADSCLLDGEAVGDVYHVFDLLERGAMDLRPNPYAVRYNAALNLVDAIASDAVRYAETATTISAKRRMLDRLREQKQEGIVFKHRLGPYAPGRPASGGTQFKLKFTATASCIVAGVNGAKHSVRLELLDGSRRVGVGNVTIPPNHDIPAAGQVVEVRYLYAFAGGSLYQPVYLGRRDDVDREDCKTEQLKFKADDEDGEDI